MNLVAPCPFGITAIVWQPRPDEHRLTVCVKVTFALMHGHEASLAPVQEPACDDVYYENNPHGTLYMPSDHVPFKPRADVLLVGRAHAPPGSLTQEVVAGLSVGDFSKWLRIKGDRSPVKPTPEPFLSMPLRYERAAMRGENLAGLADAYHALPNIEVINESGGLATPGFGPLHPMWRARRARLDDTLVRWAYDLRTHAAGPVPQGFDFGFFNAAPRDQQVSVIEAGATIVLMHLHPMIARLETRLPRLRPRAFRVDVSGRRIEIPLSADTLWIDTDRVIAVVSFRGTIPVRDAAEAARTDLLVTSEQEAAPQPAQRRAVLPFNAEIPSKAAPREPPPPPPPPPPPENDLRSTMALSEEQALGLLGDLPFTKGPSSTKPPPALWTAPQAPQPHASQPPKDDEDDPDTLPPPPPAPAPNPSRPAIEPPPLLKPVKAIPPPKLDPAPPRFEPTPPSFTPKPPSLRPEAPVAPEPPLVAPPAPITAPSAPITVPPVREAPKTNGTHHVAAEQAAALFTPPPKERRRERGREGEMSIRAWASIQSALLTGAERGDVLDQHGITQTDLASFEARFREAITHETDRGSDALLSEYDEAFVEGIERAKGPISAEGYARIVIGRERGRIAVIAEALGVPRSAMMRIERVWRRRINRDPALGREVARLIDEARRR